MRRRVVSGHLATRLFRPKQTIILIPPCKGGIV
ncbi:MAG: hypothetical protein KatS3mg077_2915 [Candidatus Binatia bacterium]|nr:MAG: hypothetical protein KatS3mg077_2915 [Candidatus Binatia bacterium]